MDIFLFIVKVIFLNVVNGSLEESRYILGILANMNEIDSWGINQHRSTE